MSKGKKKRTLKFEVTVDMDSDFKQELFVGMFEAFIGAIKLNERTKYNPTVNRLIKWPYQKEWSNFENKRDDEMSYKYKVKYSIEMERGEFTKEDLEKAGKGGTDALFFVSMLYPPEWEASRCCLRVWMAVTAKSFQTKISLNSGSCSQAVLASLKL